MKPWICTSTGSLINLEHVAMIEVQQSGQDHLVLATLGRLVVHLEDKTVIRNKANSLRNKATGLPLRLKRIGEECKPDEVLLAVFPSASKAEAYRLELKSHLVACGGKILEALPI
jgi:hypothetical protein